MNTNVSQAGLLGLHAKNERNLKNLDIFYLFLVQYGRAVICANICFIQKFGSLFG